MTKVLLTSQTMPMKLLIVDDNKVNVLVGTKILGMFGYDNIASAADGQQAVEAAEADAYDLIFLDLQMPVLDGFRALERITSSPLAGNPCVVALTANADMVSAQFPVMSRAGSSAIGAVVLIARKHKSVAMKPASSTTFPNPSISPNWKPSFPRYTSTAKSTALPSTTSSGLKARRKRRSRS